MNGVECEYATGNGFCCLSACNNINLLGNVVSKDQPQSLNVKSEPQSNWHTGTPAEEGWYLGYTNADWFVILRWEGKAFDVYSDYSGDIVAWQKIEEGEK